MATTLTTKELRAMQATDLRKELSEKQILLQKIRLGIELRKEKDTAKLKRERRQISRMQTILREKRATISAPQS